jgi:hypothetical protein
MSLAKRSLLLSGLALLALSGCGGRQQLALPAGEAPPMAPATAARAPTSAELLTPPPIARPERVTEILRRSEERQEDRFDLPPPG